VALLVAVGCAPIRTTPTVPREPLARLEDPHFALTVQEPAKLFGEGDAVNQLIEGRLTARGAVLEGSARQTLVFVIGTGSHEVSEAQLECVTVEVIQGQAGAAYLPSRPLSAKRCVAPGGGVVAPNDALGAIITATALAIDASTGELAKRAAAARAAALEHAVEAVIAQLPLRRGP